MPTLHFDRWRTTCPGLGCSRRSKSSSKIRGRMKRCGRSSYMALVDPGNRSSSSITFGGADDIMRQCSGSRPGRKSRSSETTSKSISFYLVSADGAIVNFKADDFAILNIGHDQPPFCRPPHITARRLDDKSSENSPKEHPKFRVPTNIHRQPLFVRIAELNHLHARRNNPIGNYLLALPH